MSYTGHRGLVRQMLRVAPRGLRLVSCWVVRLVGRVGEIEEDVDQAYSCLYRRAFVYLYPAAVVHPQGCCGYISSSYEPS